MSKHPSTGRELALRRLPARRANIQAMSQMRAPTINKLNDLVRSSDALADAVIAEQQCSGPDDRHKFKAAVEGGVAGLTEPMPAVKALLTQCERSAMPSTKRCFDLRTCVPPSLVSLGLTAALLHAESAPAIAFILTRTGELTTSTLPRLMNVGRWFDAVMSADGAHVGSDGYTQTLRLRVMHARIRAGVLRGAWNSDEWGVPINHLDMARTWLDFAYVPIVVLGRFGCALSEDNLREHYRTWRTIGRLLGVDASVCAKLTSSAQAEKLLAMVDATHGAPDDNSRALAAALFQAIEQKIARSPGGPDLPTYRAMLRKALGDKLSDALAV